MSNPIMEFFSYKHLTDNDLQSISIECADLAHSMNETLSDGPEKSAGLRKLLEAKDCFVRSVIQGRSSWERNESTAIGESDRLGRKRIPIQLPSRVDF